MAIPEKKPAIDFLIIGAQKAATTWLASVLRQHPDIWLPPKKELHYFDADKKYPSANYLSAPPIKRIFGKGATSRHFRRHAKKFISNSLKQFFKSPNSENLNELFWFLRYFFFSSDNNWYLSLFNSGAGKIKGEATPSYALLDLSDVKKIHQLFPDLKIIFIMRNPVHRAWSQARFSWTRKLIDNIQDIEQMKKFVDGHNQHARSDYQHTLSAWHEYFASKQIFIGFYDDIEEDPRKFISNICHFLGTESSRLPSSVDLTTRVNVAKKSDLPPELKHYLITKYLPTIQYVADRYDGPPKSWLREAQTIATDGYKNS